ncbi:Uncharacterised protein [uncultured archaeon]|nr:Uncharacterised protein [uncultured archaeon]
MKKIKNFKKTFFASLALLLVLSLAGIAFLNNSGSLPSSFLMVFKTTSGQSEAFIQTSFPVNNEVLQLPSSIDLNDFIVNENVTNFEVTQKTDFNSLLQKSIGKNVLIKTQNSVIEGILVSADPIIVNTTAGLTSVFSYDSVSIEGSQNFVSQPVITFPSDYKKDSARISFFSGSLTFNNKYVGILDGTSLTFSSQSSLQNNLGFNLKDAKLAIAVGTLNKGQLFYPQPQYGVANSVVTGAAKDSMQVTPSSPEAIQGFKQIVLSDLVNLEDGKSLFFSIIPQQTIQVTKESRLEYTGNPTVTISFNNSLGDLPQGTLSVYSMNSEGFLSFSTETTLQDYLNQSEVTFDGGRNYFVYGEKREVVSNKISSCIFENTYNWKIKNTGQTDENVSVVEHLYGSFQVIKEDSQHENEDANTLVWKLIIPKGTTDFSYSIRTNSC